MSEHNAIGSALYTALSSAGGTVVWSNRIYERLGPQGVVYPYLLYNYVSGGETNLTPTDGVDLHYDVRVLAKTAAESRNGAGYIRSALHNVTLTLTGWTAISSECVGLISRIDVLENVNYFTDGFEVRIRAEKA